SFNTAIAGIMECLNALSAAQGDSPAESAAMAEAIRLVALVLAPFAPHLADEIGEAYGFSGSAVEVGWPSYDEKLVVDDMLPYAVQVNGKLRAEVKVPAAAMEAEVKQAALAEAKVEAALSGKTIRKVVFVPK